MKGCSVRNICNATSRISATLSPAPVPIVYKIVLINEMSEQKANQGRFVLEEPGKLERFETQDLRILARLIEHTITD